VVQRFRLDSWGHWLGLERVTQAGSAKQSQRREEQGIVLGGGADFLKVDKRKEERTRRRVGSEPRT
jgi:hypothetical protein